MLRNANDIIGLHLAAQDGEIGRVKDIYFEDEHWAVRYLVADTGKWLPQRKVLISPFAVRGFNPDSRALNVNLSKEQVRSSPPIEEHLPVSRQYELEYHKYYGWPYYWQGPAVWGPVPTPVWTPNISLEESEVQSKQASRRGDPHLRSVAEIVGYHIHVRDGEMGHVDDFIFDDDDWRIQYLVVDTRNWLPGKKVLVAPQWGASFDWEKSRVHMDFDRTTIQRAPEYDASIEINREYEQRLFRHYHRPPYWEERMAA